MTSNAQPLSSQPANRRGRVQLYTGDGKGKTTAALGLAFRAAGHGWRVHILHFMKQDSSYGEIHSAGRMGNNWQVEQCGRANFVNRQHPAAEDIACAQQGLQRAFTLAGEGQIDLLILDELINALDFGLVSLEAVLELLACRAPATELVLTGRNAPAPLIAAADLVTEMRCIKHYYNAGLEARLGIEY